MPGLIEITLSTCYRNPVKIPKFHKVAQTSAINRYRITPSNQYSKRNIESRYWQYTCQKQHGQHKAAKKSTHNQLLLVTRSIQSLHPFLNPKNTHWESVNGFPILGGEIKNPYHGKQKKTSSNNKITRILQQKIARNQAPFFPQFFSPNSW